MENWRRRIARERGWIGEFSGPTEGHVGMSAKVYTVTELPPELQEVMVEKLEAMIRGPVNVEFRTDSSIIGGMVIQVGSKVVDMSVARELRELGHRVQEVIGAHLAALAATWTMDSDAALEPDPVYLSHLAEMAERQVEINAVH